MLQIVFMRKHLYINFDLLSPGKIMLSLIEYFFKYIRWVKDLLMYEKARNHQLKLHLLWQYFLFSPVEGLHSFVAPDCDDRGTDNSSSVHLGHMVLGYSKHYHVHNMGREFVLRLQVCRLENKVKCCCSLMVKMAVHFRKS